VPKPSSKALSRVLKVYLLAVALWIPAMALAHGNVVDSKTWVNPPTEFYDSIRASAQYYVSEPHAVVAMTTCIQRRVDGVWKDAGAGNCVVGRHNDVRGVYQRAVMICDHDGTYRSRRWAHVEGDDGTLHLELIDTSSTRTINCGLGASIPSNDEPPGKQVEGDHPTRTRPLGFGAESWGSESERFI
jgi:hypothetical protein